MIDIVKENITHAFDLEIVKKGRPVLVVGSNDTKNFNGYFLVNDVTESVVTVVDSQRVTSSIDVYDVVNGNFTVEFLDQSTITTEAVK